MLIQFSAQNWKSLRDEQTLSLVKAKGDELVLNSFTANIQSPIELLRSAVIYGANAAGKTNFISALRAMKKIVLDSTKNQVGDEINVVPFVLDSEFSQAPTEFEVLFIAKDKKFQYGFSVTSDTVVSEWLIAYPNGRPQKWFTRNLNKDGSYLWSYGGSFLGQKQLWQESTRSNGLFLSTATQLNSAQLKPVYDWFKSTLRIGSVAGWNPNYTASKCEAEEQKTKVLEFLRAADLDISDLNIIKEEIGVKHLPESMPDEVKQQFLDEMKNRHIYDIKTVHLGSQGQSVEFNFTDESDGTKKLFSFAGPWLDVLKNGRVLFIDELHDNLHPKLVKFLVELFHNPKTNPNNAQLVFTTHETSIMNQEVFRRDQIWFCEKSRDQSTRLYPLTDFSPKKGRENLEDAYLTGRYGAVPYVRKITEVES